MSNSPFFLFRASTHTFLSIAASCAAASSSPRHTDASSVRTPTCDATLPCTLLHSTQAPRQLRVQLRPTRRGMQHAHPFCGARFFAHVGTTDADAEGAAGDGAGRTDTRGAD